jgi:hypothetical protein
MYLNIELSDEVAKQIDQAIDELNLEPQRWTSESPDGMVPDAQSGP